MLNCYYFNFFNLFYFRRLTMQLCRYQLRLLSHTFLLSASSCRYIYYAFKLSKYSYYYFQPSFQLLCDAYKLTERRLCLSLQLTCLFFSLFSLELLILWAPLFMRQTNILTKAPSTMVPLKLLNLAGSSALSPFFLLPLESRFLSFLVYGFMVKSNNCPRYLFICHHSIINFMHSTILPCIFDATNCCWNVIIIYEAVHPVLKKKNSGSACTSIAIEGK